MKKSWKQQKHVDAGLSNCHFELSYPLQRNSMDQVSRKFTEEGWKMKSPLSKSEFTQPAAELM